MWVAWTYVAYSVMIVYRTFSTLMLGDLLVISEHLGKKKKNSFPHEWKGRYPKNLNVFSYSNRKLWKEILWCKQTAPGG